MRPELLERIKRVVAAYPDAPEGVERYLWLTVPRYWESLTVPTDDALGVVIVPRHDDQHAGARFRVGWSERERVVALWLL